MDQCHAVCGVAVLADRRFRDPATIDFYSGGERANLAFKEGFLHLGH